MRSAVQQASQAEQQASSSASQYQQQGNQINSTLLPGLEREANNPQGYTPQEMNDQLVASEQGAGGANAGIAGEAKLAAARTRNSSALSPVLDAAARDKTRQLSENALNIQNQSANLGQKKQMAAQSELGKLYGVDMSGSLEAQGLEAKDAEVEAQAGSTGWFQNMIAAWQQSNGTINAIGNAIHGGGGGG